MNKWLTPALAIVLVISLVFIGVFYFQSTGKINDIQAQLASLQDNVSGIPTIQDDINALNSSISNLQSDMAVVKSGIATLQSDDAGIKGDISTLQSSVSQLSSAVQSSNISLADTIRKIEPTVVRVDTDFGSGSGIIVRANGYILTNQHVIDGANYIEVTLMNGDVISATVVASDVDTDIAVLKLNSNRTDFPVASIGSSSDVIVGEDVLTAGFPLGPELPGAASFTRGIISAIRYDPYTGINYIQMDAPISGGNSGGGLFTIEGILIGIPSYGFSPDAENINLSIPIELALPFIQSAAGN